MVSRLVHWSITSFFLCAKLDLHSGSLTSLIVFFYILEGPFSRGSFILPNLSIFIWRLQDHYLDTCWTHLFLNNTHTYLQGRRTVWKYGGACGVHNLTSPRSWDSVNWSFKIWGGGRAPLPLGSDNTLSPMCTILIKTRLKINPRQRVDKYIWNWIYYEYSRIIPLRGVLLALWE